MLSVARILFSAVTPALITLNVTETGFFRSLVTLAPLRMRGSRIKHLFLFSLFIYFLLPSSCFNSVNVVFILYRYYFFLFCDISDITALMKSCSSYLAVATTT